MGGNVAGDNFNAFVKSVYNMVNYKKDNTEKDKKKQAVAKRRRSEGDNDNIVNDPPMHFDEYGCAEGMWEPEIEDPVTQEIKRKAIMEDYNNDRMKEQIQTLLRDTYPLQRQFINRARTKEQWANLFASWPIMLTTLFIYEHSSLLLGKNVHSVWFKALEDANCFVEFMISYCADEAKKPSKGSQYIQMQNLLKEMDTVVQTERSIEPRSKAIIPFLIMYMKERSSDLFLLLSETFSDNELLEIAQKQCMTLIMIIRGQSLFDAVKCDIVIRGEYLIKVVNVLEGFLTLFLCYYVFGFCYPKTIDVTLEFMQRCFLGINPQKKGNKSTE